MSLLLVIVSFILLFFLSDVKTLQKGKNCRSKMSKDLAQAYWIPNINAFFSKYMCTNKVGMKFSVIKNWKTLSPQASWECLKIFEMSGSLLLKHVCISDTIVSSENWAVATAILWTTTEIISVPKISSLQLKKNLLHFYLLNYRKRNSVYQIRAAFRFMTFNANWQIQLIVIFCCCWSVHFWTSGTGNKWS